MAKLWTMTFRAMDDIKESVRAVHAVLNHVWSANSVFETPRAMDDVTEVVSGTRVHDACAHVCLSVHRAWSRGGRQTAGDLCALPQNIWALASVRAQSMGFGQSLGAGCHRSSRSRMNEAKTGSMWAICMQVLRQKYPFHMGMQSQE